MPKLNPGLIKHVHRQLEFITIEFEWVKGHDGDDGNENADYLAETALVTSHKLTAAESSLFLLKRLVWPSSFQNGMHKHNFYIRFNLLLIIFLHI